MNVEFGLSQDTAFEPLLEHAAPAGDDLARARRQVWILLAAFLLALTLLTAVFPVEGAVVANGQVSVDSRVKTITHPTGGVLAQLLVREGDRVSRGQALMRLDQSVLGPSARNATLSRDQLLALRARLEAERDDAPAVVFPAQLLGGGADAQAAMLREQQQFLLGKRARAGTLSLLKQRVRQFQEQIASYRVQIGAARRQRDLIQPELEGLRSLKEKGLVTINRLNETERAAIQLEATEASLAANIAQAEAQISEAQEQMLNVSQAKRVEAGASLSTVVSQLSDQDSRAALSKDTLDRSVILAPQAGVVDNIAYTTIGSSIPANQPVVQIVPDQDKLIITAQVSPANIDVLRVGQNARVRFSSLERQLSPEIPGKLIFIAAERTDEPQTGTSFYRVQIEVVQKDLDAVAGKDLRVGQPVEVFFGTGKRSILSYAIKPLLDQMRRAMRE